MKTHTYILLLLSALLAGFFGYNTHAQESMGVMRLDVGQDKIVSRQFVDSMHANLAAMKGVVHSTYSLADQELSYHPDLSATKEEQTVNQLMFYTFNIHEHYKPKLVVSRDEAGKITWVGFILEPGAVVGSKIIDLPTNTIGITRYEKIEDAFGTGIVMRGENRVQLTDYKTRFNGDPDALRRKSSSIYQQRLNKAHMDMAAKFRKIYRLKYKKIYKAILNTELEYYLPGPLPCTDIVVEKEKVKETTLHLPFAMHLPGDLSVRIFSLDTIEDYVVPQLYGFYYLDKNVDRKLTLKSGLFSQVKNVGAAHLSGRKLFASFNYGGFGTKLNTNAEELNIGLEFGQRSINKFEASLAKYQGVKLIDISFSPVVDLFRERFKQERFINSDFSPQSIGANYLLTSDENTISLIDVATSEVIFNYNAPEGVKGLIDQTMGVFNQEIEVIKITKEKKGRAKKILLYSPFGFTGNLNYKIFKATYEDVNGEKLMRPVELGQCVLNSADGVVVAEFSAYGDDGRLYNAIKNKEEIFLRNITHKLFGHEFK